MSRPLPPAAAADPNIEAFADRVAAYRTTVTMLYAWANLLADVDIPGLLRDIARAEALGPILDPTAFKAGGQAMAEDKRILQAAAALREIGVFLRDRGTPDQVH